MKEERQRHIKIKVARVLLIMAGLSLWEWGARAGHVNPLYTSYPTEILQDLIEFTLTGALFKHGSITLAEAFTGLFIGTVTGILIAVIFTQFKAIGDTLLPIVTAVHGIPQLTLAPVYILWFGLGFTSKIIIAAIMVFFNVFFATYGAISSTEQQLIEASNLLGANQYQTLRHVVLPSCVPWIMTGIRNGLGSSLVGAIVGEYMGASAGFGWMVAYATSYFNIKRVMSCIVILLLIGIVMNLLLDLIEKRLLIWQPETSLTLQEN